MVFGAPYGGDYSVGGLPLLIVMIHPPPNTPTLSREGRGESLTTMVVGTFIHYAVAYCM